MHAIKSLWLICSSNLLIWWKIPWDKWKLWKKNHKNSRTKIKHWKTWWWASTQLKRVSVNDITWHKKKIQSETLREKKRHEIQYKNLIYLWLAPQKKRKGENESKWERRKGRDKSNISRHNVQEFFWNGLKISSYWSRSNPKSIQNKENHIQFYLTKNQTLEENIKGKWEKKCYYFKEQP